MGLPLLQSISRKFLGVCHQRAQSTVHISDLIRGSHKRTPDRHLANNEHLHLPYVTNIPDNARNIAIIIIRSKYV